MTMPTPDGATGSSGEWNEGVDPSGAADGIATGGREVDAAMQDRADTCHDAGLRALFGGEVEPEEGYLPGDIAAVEPTGIVTGLSLGMGTVGTPEGPVEVAILTLAGECVECEEMHYLPATSVILPVALVRFLQKAVGEVLDGSLVEKADQWVDAEIAKLMDGATGGEGGDDGGG